MSGRQAGVIGGVGDAEAAASPTTHIAYRPDIDGLRALAVLAVVLFHVGGRGFSGGFVGVDIFFVISGYLITGIIAREVAQGRYAIANFYRRRVLRIFPAMVAMLLATSLAACWVLMPPELPDFAKSLGATALFGSNIYFYATTDYFGGDAHIKPLLHTWSLAVEEQWYILWPLLLGWIGAGRRRLMLGVIAAITVGSFLIGLWMLKADAVATFYLLPSRAWELGMGAFLALGERRLARGWLAEALALLGLALILASIKMYTNETPFPGLAALPPCLGCALLIWTGASGTFVSRLLSLRPAVFFGLISYSLYLWHWPVILFSEMGLMLPRGIGVMAGQVIVSVALATLSWRFVERPFRQHVTWPTPRILLGAAGTILGLLALAALIDSGVASVKRLTPRQERIAGYIGLDGSKLYRADRCFIVLGRGELDRQDCLPADPGKATILFMGDSHAAHLWPGLARYRDRFNVAQATATGCTPLLYPADDPRKCAQIMRWMFTRWIPEHRPAVVIISGRWSWRDIPNLEKGLADPALRAANPILLGPVPEYVTALPRLLVAADIRHDPALVQRSRGDQPEAMDRLLRGIAARQGVTYVSLLDRLCHGGACPTTTPQGEPLQFDNDHLTVSGSAMVVDAIWPEIAMRLGPASRGR